MSSAQNAHSKSSEPATTTSQLRDRNVRDAELALVREFAAYLEATAEQAGSNSHDGLLQFQTNVTTAGKNGILNVVIARNEESAKRFLGDDFLVELRSRPDEETVVFYSDDYDGSVAQPFEEMKEQLKRPGLRSAAEIVQELNE
jgi:hypothetical protein